MNGITQRLPKWIKQSESLDKILETLFAILAFRLVHQLRVSTTMKTQHAKAYMEAIKYRWTAWWIPLVHLLEHEWFERIWVAQEVVLARDARVMYGHVCCDWNDFLAGLLAFESNVPLKEALEWTQEKQAWTNKSHLRSLHVNTAAVLQLWRLRRFMETGLASFRDVMLMTHLLKANEPNDTVLGVHGLAAKGTSGSHFTEPDYSKDLGQVYLGATLRVIEENGVFELLSHAGTGYVDSMDRAHGVPSWVPDWSLERHAAPLGHMGDKAPCRVGGIFNAADSLSVVVGSLLLLGAELDIVAEVALAHTRTL